MHILVLNGPNLNFLGIRETDIYGPDTLSQIETMVREKGSELGAEIDWYQSNHEGELVDLIQKHGKEADGILINAAAYTHTSIAIRDALLGLGTPFVEVHLSNVYAREEERRRSLLADIAVGVVLGFGQESYVLGLEGLVAHLSRTA